MNRMIGRKTHSLMLRLTAHARVSIHTQVIFTLLIFVKAIVSHLNVSLRIGISMLSMQFPVITTKTICGEVIEQNALFAEQVGRL